MPGTACSEALLSMARTNDISQDLINVEHASPTLWVASTTGCAGSARMLNSDQRPGVRPCSRHLAADHTSGDFFFSDGHSALNSELAHVIALRD